jgi:hypothetical protein
MISEVSSRTGMALVEMFLMAIVTLPAISESNCDQVLN